MLCQSLCFSFQNSKVCHINKERDELIDVTIDDMMVTLRQTFGETSDNPRLIGFPNGELERSMSFDGNAIFGRFRGFCSNKVSFACLVKT